MIAFVHKQMDVGMEGRFKSFNAGKYAPYVGDEVRIDIAIEAIAP